MVKYDHIWPLKARKRYHVHYDKDDKVVTDEEATENGVRLTWHDVKDEATGEYHYARRGAQGWQYCKCGARVNSDNVVQVKIKGKWVDE